MRALFTLFLSVFSFSLMAQFDWQHTGGPQGFPYGVYAPAVTSNDFYVGTRQFLYRMNEDESWSVLDNGVSFSLAAYENKVLKRNYIYSEIEQTYVSLFSISLDYGSTFQEITTPPIDESFPSYLIVESGIFVKDDDDTPLFLSQDDGSTWNEIDLSFLPSDETQFTFSFDGDYFITHESGGLWKYDAVSGNFTEINIPAGSNTDRSAWYVNGNSIFFQESGNLWSSEDYGSTWANMPIVNNGEIEQIIISGDYLCLVIDYDELMFSTDMGQNWTEVSPFVDLSFDRLYTLNNLLYVSDSDYGIVRFNPSNQSYTTVNEGTVTTFPVQMQSRTDKVWTSTLGGIYSYDLSLGEWSVGEGIYHTGRHFAHVVFGENDKMYATKWLTDTIYTTSNGGENWTSFSMDDVTGFDYSGPVGMVSVFNEILYVEEDFGSLFKSENGGESFSITNEQEDFLRHRSVEIDGVYLSADFLNVYRSIDNGNTWTAVLEAENNNFFYVGVEKTDTHFFVVVNGKLYSSADGLDWKFSHAGFMQDAELMNEDLTFEDSERIWEHEDIFYYKSAGSYFYSSVDTCKTWLPIAQNAMFKMTMTDEGLFYGGYDGVSTSEIPRGYGELVRGTAYHDANNNGVWESDEVPIEGVQVGIDGGNGVSGYYSTATNEEGEYVIGVFTSEEDSIKAIVNNPYFESINPIGYSIEEGGDNRDFGVYLTPDIADLSIQEGRYIPAVRPGFEAEIGMTYVNIGSVATGGKIGMKLDPTFTFIEATPAPDEVFADSLVWNISEMDLSESDFLRVKVNVDVDAELGTFATTNLHLYNDLPDNNETDNHYILSDIIVGSYDPNAKSVNPENGLTDVQIADKEELIYTVQFQNTGTYLAETVRITDQLDTALYLPSLRFIAASHDVSSFELKPGGLLEVIFNNINLPDSLSNESDSHGFVSFAVRRNENFNADREVKNTAAIYFDFNEPIFTNEVSFGVPIDTTSGEVAVRNIPIEDAPELIIYPNPTSSKFSITSEEKLTGMGRITVFDANGKIILRQRVFDVSQAIFVDLKPQITGMFNILMETRRRNLTGQVLIQK